MFIQAVSKGTQSPRNVSVSVRKGSAHREVKLVLTVTREHVTRETVLHDTVMADTCHYTFVKTHKMYSIKSET